MDIKFKDLQRIEGESNGKVWIAYKIIGIKLEDGKEWESTNIFDNPYNADILEELRGLEAGEKVAVKHTKNKQGYWTVSGLGKVSENPSRPASGAGGSSGSSSKKKGGDTMTKEEWAKKNEVDRIRIAKSVALKAAVENTKIGADPDAVLKVAIKFMPFLTDDMLGDEVPFDMGGEDGLDAPEV
jgi:hypothetical protein